MGTFELHPEEIPRPGCFWSRAASVKDVPRLAEMGASSEMVQIYISQGFLGVVAGNDTSIVAMAWAFIGPGECAIDEGYGSGFRWKLKANEAWLQGALSSPAFRGTGAYRTAYRTLLEELGRREVSSLFTRISCHNLDSVRVHKKLGLEAITYISYLRLLGMGRYDISSVARSRLYWTAKRYLVMSPYGLPGKGCGV